MPNKTNSGLSWVFAAIGLAGAGFAAGLHRFVWLLYWVLTILWLVFIYYTVEEEHAASVSLAASGYAGNDHQSFWWILGIGAPVVVAIILRIVEGIVLSLFGGKKPA